jgi:hypothetical protein
MHAGLIAQVTSGDELAAAGAPWLQDVLTEVFPDLYDGLRTRPVVRDRERPRSDIDLPWGQPGHVLGVLRTYQSRPLIPGRDVMFSDKSWPRFLSRLGRYPHAVDVGINELDGLGFPVHRGWAGIGIQRDHHLPEWYRFTFDAMARIAGDSGSVGGTGQAACCRHRRMRRGHDRRHGLVWEHGPATRGRPVLAG